MQQLTSRHIYDNSEIITTQHEIITTPVHSSLGTKKNLPGAPHRVKIEVLKYSHVTYQSVANFMYF